VIGIAWTRKSIQLLVQPSWSSSCPLGCFSTKCSLAPSHPLAPGEGPPDSHRSCGNRPTRLGRSHWPTALIFTSLMRPQCVERYRLMTCASQPSSKTRMPLHRRRRRCSCTRAAVSTMACCRYLPGGRIPPLPPFPYFSIPTTPEGDLASCVQHVLQIINDAYANVRRFAPVTGDMRGRGCPIAQRCRKRWKRDCDPHAVLLGSTITQLRGF
jgi:hypothetical protein